MNDTSLHHRSTLGAPGTLESAAQDPALALAEGAAPRLSGEAAVRALVEDTVTEYVHLVAYEPDHPLHARLASPSLDDREAMGRLIYHVAMLAGVYANAPAIDAQSTQRDVRREVRTRTWLRSMGYDYIAQTVEDPAVALSLKALLG